jgi:uridylate kinase
MFCSFKNFLNFKEFTRFCVIQRMNLLALFCVAVNAEVVLKATNVDGVYDSDPRKNANATLLNHVSYRDVALKNLSVMDITAITLCQENHIPVVVFNLNKPGNISRALSGEQIGTLIDDTGLNPTTS